MDLRDLVRAIRARWILPVLAVLFALAGAGVVTWQITPQYAATTYMFVSTPGSDDTVTAYQGNLLSKQRVTSYAELLERERLAARVVNSLGLDTTPEALSTVITASVVPETVILQVTVTDPSPERAQMIADAVGVEFPQLITELERPPGQDVANVIVTVVESARLPTSPTSPSWIINLGLAAVLGLLVGIGLAMLREQLDNTVKRSEDVDEIAGSAVIGGVLFDSDFPKKPIARQLRGQSRSAEAFRQIRTNLQFLNIDDPPRVLVISSSVPGEGKTTTAVALAIVLAQSGQRVVLVEGDLRRPRVTKYLDIVSGTGLTNVLAGVASLEDVLQPLGDGKLTVLGSGPTPPNPSEMLGSAHMRQLITELRETNDYVVIDSSPLLPVTDGAVLGALCDGVVLVTRHGTTKREQLRQSVQMLRSVDAHLLGIVLNMVPPKSATAYGYGYGYSYAADKPIRKDGVRAKPSKHELHDTAPVPVVRDVQDKSGAVTVTPARRDRDTSRPRPRPR